MDKKTFHKKQYYRPLQVLFWISFILLAFPGIWAIMYEDDLPFIGVVWIAGLAIIFWIIKRTAYHVMFGEKILPRK